MFSFLRRLWEGLAAALIRPINKVAAMTLSIYTLVWGVWLASPFWNVFTTAPIYAELRDIAPELAWGLLAIGVGLVMIYGVLRHSKKSLTSGAFAGFIHWLLIAFYYFVGDWRNTGGITSAAMALYCASIYLNLKVIEDDLPFAEDGDKISNRREEAEQ